MKIREGVLIGAAALLLTVRPIGAARQRGARAGGLRVTWVSPKRVPPAQRPALARFLAAAVSGEMPRGLRVQDSRPRFDGPWLGELQVYSSSLLGETRAGDRGDRGALRHPCCVLRPQRW